MKKKIDITMDLGVSFILGETLSQAPQIRKFEFLELLEMYLKLIIVKKLLVILYDKVRFIHKKLNFFMLNQSIFIRTF